MPAIQGWWAEMADGLLQNVAGPTFERSAVRSSIGAIVAAAACVAAPACGTACAPPGGTSDREPQANVREPFTDVARSSGLDFVHFNGMSGEQYMVEMMGPGGAFLDYDGDGDQDVLLLQGRMLGEGKTLEDALIPPVGPPAARLFRNDLGVAAGDGASPRFV